MSGIEPTRGHAVVMQPGDGPSYWRIELGDRAHAQRVKVPMDAVEQEEDPSEGGGEPEDVG